jgi:molecular chaperone DnaJ
VADYYELLGVSRSSTAEEIKKAYRRKARELHPDANPGDPVTEERFKQVAQAYEVLSDADSRARYDRFGEAGVGSASGPNLGDMFSGGGFGDLFDAFFGGAGGNPFGGGGRGGPAGPPRGQDLEVVADIEFAQAVFGATVAVEVRTALRCEDCDGSGAGAGTQPVTCSECNGRGQVQRVRQSMLGQMVTASACPRCGGLGQVIVTPCATCNGEGRVIAEKTYQVDVPAGVDTGSTLRLTGRGAVGPRGGGAGDLYVHVRVGRHETFSREGDDLVAELPISIAQAALGTKIVMPTLDGEEEIAVPVGTQPGKEFVFRQRGVHRLHGRGRGDLRVRVNVQVPTKLNEFETELLTKYAESRGEAVGTGEQGLFSRIKSAFS